jgi:hypothetical protein
LRAAFQIAADEVRKLEAMLGSDEKDVAELERIWKL